MRRRLLIARRPLAASVGRRAVALETAPLGEAALVDAPYCCLSCRLLQPRTNTCAHCGATVVARIELLQELLGYHDMRLEGERDLGLVTALLAGGSLAVPLLLPAALISLGVLVVRAPLRRRRARARANHEMVSVTVPPPMVGRGSVRVLGVASSLRGARARALASGASCLATSMTVATSSGVLLRAVRAVPFVVRTPHSGPVVVTGEIRVIDRGAPRQRIAPGDPLLAQLGVPDDLRIAGVLDEASIGDGDGVAVWGPLVDEAVGDLAFHRDGGVVRVMRGEVGAPVLVSALPRS